MNPDPDPAQVDPQTSAEAEPRCFPVLDRYWETLQRGQAADPEQWLQYHPEGQVGIRELRLLAVMHEACQTVSQDSQTPLSDPASTAGEVVPARRLLPPGTMLGEYRVEGLLGYGGMGEVYLARHELLGRAVAVKVLPEQLTGNPETERRFRKEIKALARPSPHPNLAVAFHAGEDRGRLYLVMEYVKGENLWTHVKRSGSLPVAQACAYMRQAAIGLDHAHGQRIIHRDIKPSNLLLTPDGTIKVLDLGLARAGPAAGAARSADDGTIKVLDLGLARLLVPEGGGGDASLAVSGTAAGALLGTLDYIAPEQARHAGLADARSDLYSLGCTFYCLLAGRPPYWDRLPVAKLRAHAEEEPEPIRQARPEVPEAVAVVVDKLLAKRPEDRYPSARAFIEALDTATGSARPKPLRPVVLTRRGWLVAAGGLVLVLVMVGFLLWSRHAPTLADPEKPPLKADIEGLVWASKFADADRFEPGDPRRQRLPVQDAVPLTSRDWVRFDIRLNRPAYLYLVWIDTEGKAEPLYPWQDHDWQKRPEHEEARDRLSEPRDDEGMSRLAPGPAGVETLLLLARDEPLTVAENATLVEMFSRPRVRRPLPNLAVAVAVWLENGERGTDPRDRGPPVGKVVEASGDPELQVRGLLRRLRGLFPYSCAVCYGNRGKN